MKVRRVVHTRLFGKCYKDAKEALKYARTLITSPGGTEEGSDLGSESDTEDEEGHPPLSATAKRLSQIPTLAVSIPETSRPKSMMLTPMTPKSVMPTTALVPSGPSCANCKKVVSMPCWYCVQCAESTFICWECDMKGEISFGTHDYHTHDLVRVAEVVEEKDLSVEERLGELEERFMKHEKTMDERLGRLETTVDGRLVKVERLLEQLLLKLGTS